MNNKYKILYNLLKRKIGSDPSKIILYDVFCYDSHKNYFYDIQSIIKSEVIKHLIGWIKYGYDEKYERCRKITKEYLKALQMHNGDLRNTIDGFIKKDIRYKNIPSNHYIFHNLKYDVEIR